MYTKVSEWERCQNDKIIANGKMIMKYGSDEKNNYLCKVILNRKIMATISVDILNPRALNLLEELAGLQLIAIRKDTSRSSDFMSLVKQIRSKSQNPPSLEEITAEVEQHRAEMYAASN